MKNLIPIVATTLMLFAALSSGALAAPADTLFDEYFNIQTALAKNSLKNVTANARAIADIVRGDKTGVFRSELASAADALSVSNDLEASRQIFKSVSGYLIQLFRAGKAPDGTIREFHDFAYNVNWLERGDTAHDPYLGRSGSPAGTSEP